MQPYTATCKHIQPYTSTCSHATIYSHTAIYTLTASRIDSHLSCNSAATRCNSAELQTKCVPKLPTSYQIYPTTVPNPSEIFQNMTWGGLGGGVRRQVGPRAQPGVGRSPLGQLLNRKITSKWLQHNDFILGKIPFRALWWSKQFL